MPRTTLPIDVLPAWMALNDVSLYDIKISQIRGKGFGLVADGHMSTAEETFDLPTLLTVPHNLILNAEAVEQYAKEDRNFRQLLDAVGHQSTRGDVLLFLLVQLYLSSNASDSPVSVSNGWTEYVKFLPERVPLPTLWTDEERLLLKGTSLERAVTAKMLALAHEFDSIREKSSAIPCWEDSLWESSDIHLATWFLIDAWYRSRSLELPRSGESMVPCIDMANHSRSPTAFYEENAKDEVVLMLPAHSNLSKGAEITINYGDGKSAAEMLFSYGFIDEDSTAETLTIPIEPFPDDPLAKAKVHVFGGSATITVKRVEGQLQWESPFAYLMCLNEEDGIDFRLLQETDGTRQLKLFWQDADVTGSAASFESLIESHPMQAIFELRVVTVIQERLQVQLEQMRSLALESITTGLVRPDCLEAALLLRKIESKTLEAALNELEDEKLKLLHDESVVAYLGSMEVAQNDIAGEEASNEEVDFS